MIFFHMAKLACTGLHTVKSACLPSICHLMMPMIDHYADLEKLPGDGMCMFVWLMKASSEAAGHNSRNCRFILWTV